MFPNMHDKPPFGAKQFCVSAVASYIACNFLFPILNIFFGITKHLGQPCQKQPFTKIASFIFGNAKSGRPWRSRCLRQPVTLMDFKIANIRASVVLFPRLFIAAIFRERAGLHGSNAGKGGSTSLIRGLSQLIFLRIFRFESRCAHCRVPHYRNMSMCANQRWQDYLG